MSPLLATTTLSSKGQIVLPKNLRKNWRKGDKLLLIRDGERMVMMRADQAMVKLADDMEFAKRTAAVVERYEKDPARFQKLSKDQFLRELERW